MRLWHQKIVPVLPRQQLLGQHREIAALRGNGWGRRHATVNYVFEHSPYRLYLFHVFVMDIMVSRGYHPDELWRDPLYRGRSCAAYEVLNPCAASTPIYPEHNTAYLRECLANLADKGVMLDITTPYPPSSTMPVAPYTEERA